MQARAMCPTKESAAASFKLMANFGDLLRWQHGNEAISNTDHAAWKRGGSGLSEIVNALHWILAPSGVGDVEAVELSLVRTLRILDICGSVI